MATLRQPVTAHWRDRAIAGSDVITDILAVGEAYLARIAELVLLLCMFATLLEIFTLPLPPWFGMTVAYIQSIMLDAAGFGLFVMAYTAKKQGYEEVARKASTFAYWLVGLMVATILIVNVGNLFPTIKPTLSYVDDGLILARVAFTIIYRVVISKLKAAKEQHEEQRDTMQEDLQQAQNDLAETRQTITHLEQQLQTQITTSESKQVEKINDLSQQLAEIKTTLETRNTELSHVQHLLSQAQNESSLKAQQYGKNELSWKSEMQRSVNEAREEMKALMKAEQQEEMKALREKIDALSRVNAELKAQVKGQIKTPGKLVKPLSSEKFDTKAFVFACLQENAEMKLSEIVMKAKMQGQELSEPTISRYRKEWRESSNESRNESSAM